MGLTSRHAGIASIRARFCSILTPKLIARDLVWDDAILDPERDTAAFRATRLVSSIIAFPWNDDRPPRTPWHETVIYELHVKGFTQQHPECPGEAARHLCRAGFARRHRAFSRSSVSPRSSCFRCIITSTNIFSSTRGRSNYWGYNTLGLLRA